MENQWHVNRVKQLIEKGNNKKNVLGTYLKI